MSASPLPSTWDVHSPRFWVLLAAVSTFVPAFVISGIGFWGITLKIASGVTVGSVGALLWWLLIERPSKPTLLRGTVFGVLTNLIANPLAWLIHGILLLVLGGSTPIANAIHEGGFLNGFYQYILSRTEVSLLVIGLITFPLAIILGLILAALRRRTLQQGS